MAKFHINKETGIAGRCSAQIKCPFGIPLDEHYNSLQEAQYAFEQEMKEKNFPKMKKVFQEELKNLDANQLAHRLFYAMSSQMEDQLHKSLELSSILHAGQRRMFRGNATNTPYIEHPLRAAVRLAEHGVSNEVTIKTALLHDTVEDGSKTFAYYFISGGKNFNEIASRSALLAYIQRNFGEETSISVSNVTNEYINPLYAKKLSQVEKREKYLQHMKDEVLDNPHAVLVKMSDFLDNAGSLKQQYDPEKAFKQGNSALKYAPCVKLLQDSLRHLDESFITLEGKNYFHSQLSRTESRLHDVINMSLKDSKGALVI